MQQLPAKLLHRVALTWSVEQHWPKQPLSWKGAKQLLHTTKDSCMLPLLVALP